MRKSIYLKAIALGILMAFQFSAFAQKIESAKPSRANVRAMHISFLGYIDGDEYTLEWARLSGKAKLAASDGNKIKKEIDLFLEQDGKKFNPEAVLMAKNEIIVAYNAGLDNAEAGIYVQKYDKDFSLLSTSKVLDFIDNEKRGQRVLFSSNNIVDNSLHVDYHEDTRNILFRYSFRTIGNDGISYGRIVLADKDLKIKNEIDFVPDNQEHRMSISNAKFSDDGDAFVLVAELSREENKRGKKAGAFNQIEKSGVVYIPNSDGEARMLELTTKGRKVKNAAVANQIDKDGKLSYAIASTDGNGQTMYVNRYKYHPGKDELETDVVSFDITSVPNYIHDKLVDYSLQTVHSFDDGSNIFVFTSSYLTEVRNEKGRTSMRYTDNGYIALKMSDDGNIQWTSYLPKYSSVYHVPSVNGFLDFIDREGNLNLIFNINRKVYDSCQKMFINGAKMKEPKAPLLPPKDNNIRIAKFDSKTGKITLATVAIPGIKSGHLNIADSYKINDSNGYLNVTQGKNGFQSKIDFN